MPEFKLNSIYLFITKYCNLKCRHCYIDPPFIEKDGSVRRDGEIELPYIIGALTQAKKMGALKLVKITGGEAFLRKDEVLELLKWLKKNDLDIRLETNATLVGEKEARAIRDAGVKTVSVSLDGADAATHEKIRGVPGCFQRSLEGIRLIRKFNPKMKLQLVYSLWQQNKDLMKMVALAQGLEATVLKINPITRMSDRSVEMYKKGELLSVGEFLKVNAKIMKYQLSMRPGMIPVIFDVPMAFKPVSFIPGERSICGIQNLMGILSDGTITICGTGRHITDFHMGNIRESKIKDVW
ncbi:MAG: radical SAM protein, partial [Endomicrobiales bacterium]